MAGREREVGSLVRRAKAELRGGHRSEALELLQKALAIDPESNAVTEAILQIERESSASRKPKSKPKPAAGKARKTEKPKRRSASKKKPPRKKKTDKPKTRKSAEETPEKGAAPPSPKKQEPKPRQTRSRRLRAVPDAMGGDKKPQKAKKKAPAEKKTVEESPGKTEKEGPMPSTEQLETLLDTADEAMRSGNDSRVVETLKRARALAPEDGRVRDMTERYKSSRKVRKAMDLSRKALADGDPRKATVYARKAFQLDPAAPGIEELLEEIESSGGAEPAPKKTGKAAAQSGGEADTYVQKIREKIQISSFPEAAKLTQKALADYPDNELLQTFDEKFRKMGLID